MDLPVPSLPHPERSFGPREPRVATAARRRDRREHTASLRVDLLDAIFGDLKQVWPSKAVPACAATSIERSTFPLAGSKAFSLSPDANQTCWPSKVTPFTRSAPGKGPYSRRISAADRFMLLILVTRQGPGSNKIVGNPGTGGVIQRRARPRPNDCTLPAAASCSIARCTVRGLAPSAIARAELDHDLPSARKASTAACCSSTGGASTTTSRARRGASAKPGLSRSRRRACEAPREVARLRPATVRDAIYRRASPGRRGRRARSSARLRARLRQARVRGRTIPGASRARPPCRRPARHCGTRPQRAPPTPEAPRPPRAGAGAPRHARSGAPRACS